ETNVAEVRPEEAAGEFNSENIEYNVAVKSHAGSGASVLATSIQTVLLGSRMLTPSTAPTCKTTEDTIDQECFYSRKVFGFTDNLDVLNRWLKDNRDADGKKRLARLRSSDQSRDAYDARFAVGQVWKFSEQIGFDLSRTL